MWSQFVFCVFFGASVVPIAHELYIYYYLSPACRKPVLSSRFKLQPTIYKSTVHRTQRRSHRSAATLRFWRETTWTLASAMVTERPRHFLYPVSNFSGNIFLSTSPVMSTCLCSRRATKLLWTEMDCVRLLSRSPRFGFDRTRYKVIWFWSDWG